MYSVRTVAILCLLVVHATNVGCAVGPDPARPTTPLDDDAVYLQASGSTSADAYEAAGWWTTFGDEATEQLVRRVIAGNTDLQATAARVDEADALLDAAGGELLPELSLRFTPSRSQQFLDLPVGVNQFDSEIYDLRLAARWDVDLWGQQRRARQAALFRERQARAVRIATAHRVVAEALRARIEIAVLAERLRLAEADVETRRRTLDVVTDTYRAGLGDAIDLELAREAFASSQARLPPLRVALARTRHALAVLAGEVPSRAENVSDLSAGLPPLPAGPPPESGLPVALLDRRPDLLASEFRASALVAEVVQSIFYRGVLLNRVEAAEARARAAAAEYVGDVLRAIREVEDALVAERGSREELAFSEEALDAATRAERLALRDYQAGIGELLIVLDASRQRRRAEERVQLARRDVWVERVNLHLALGGDWGLPEVVEPPPVPSEANVMVSVKRRELSK
jgi:outer membrane protein TolC